MLVVHHSGRSRGRFENVAWREMGVAAQGCWFDMVHSNSSCCAATLYPTFLPEMRAGLSPVCQIWVNFAVIT